MALHKDPQGNIHDDMNGAALHLLPPGCVSITQAEANALRAPTAAQMAADKAAILTQARAIRETVLNRLTGIQLNTPLTDMVTISAIQTARTSLLNITSIASVVAATDGSTTKSAVITEWNHIELVLKNTAPNVSNVFVGVQI